MTDASLSFADEMATSMLSGLELPVEFRELFEFMEANGFLKTYTRRKGRYLSLYPGPWRDGQSLVSFQPGESGYSRCVTIAGMPGRSRRA